LAIANNSFLSAAVGVRLVDDGYSFPANSGIHINGNSFDPANVCGGCLARLWRRRQR